MDPLLTQNEVSTTAAGPARFGADETGIDRDRGPGCALGDGCFGGGGPAANSANADKDCSDFANQAQAQSYFTSRGGSASNDFDNLDAGRRWRRLPNGCPAPLDCAGSGGGGGGGGQTAPKAKRVSPHVVAAVDGDTLKVDLKNGEEWDVRLIGIDTPETVRPNTPVQCGGPQASTSMHGLTPDGRHVTLVSDPTQGPGADTGPGACSTTCSTAARTWARFSCEEGWAEVYVYQHNPFEKVRTFSHAEHRAENADRGVWNDFGGNFHTPQ